MNTEQLKAQIELIQKDINNKKPETVFENKATISEVINRLDQGIIRVAEKIDNQWVTNTWIKNAILMYFRLMPLVETQVGPFSYNDKIPLKSNFSSLNVRVVPPATARFGSFMENGVVLMPSYVNIGAWVGAHTMVDTWATVGSCAQIGKEVHLSGGVGIGGVLEPVTANPVIIEDGAFIGSRCIIVEGVKVGTEAVLAANVTLTASTPIIDTRNDELKVSKGEIPPRAVVLPGTREKKTPGGSIFTSCVYIVGERKASTDKKTSLNNVLREFSLSV